MTPAAERQHTAPRRFLRTGVAAPVARRFPASAPTDVALTPRELVDVSVSVVTYNTAARLVQCLQSIGAAVGELSHEVFVVDNGSRDDADIVVYRDFPHARLMINERNVGFARANNQAIQLSRGRYVFVTNPDVVMLPGSLERMVAFMDEHPEAGAVGCRLEYPDGSLQLSCREFPTVRTFLARGLPFPERLGVGRRSLRRYLMEDWDHAAVREIDWCLGSCLLVRRETIEEVGGLDPRFFLYYEDIDWCYRIQRKGWKIYYLPDARMIHFYRRASASFVPNRLTFHHLLSASMFFLKYLPERGFRTLW